MDNANESSKRLLIAADLHGCFASWTHLVTLLGDGDGIAIAGDLFDTKYGYVEGIDYQPEIIREEYSGLDVPKYLVSGNCDHEKFFPGLDSVLDFEFLNIRFRMSHGHRKTPWPDYPAIMIEGHSHVKKLERHGEAILVNPGSPSNPRDGIASYAVVENETISLVAVNSGIVIDSMDILSSQVIK